jgi:hypothetical protein
MAPVRTDAYTIRAGDGDIAADRKTCVLRYKRSAAVCFAIPSSYPADPMQVHPRPADGHIYSRHSEGDGVHRLPHPRSQRQQRHRTRLPAKNSCLMPPAPTSLSVCARIGFQVGEWPLLSSDATFFWAPPQCNLEDPNNPSAVILHTVSLPDQPHGAFAPTQPTRARATRTEHAPAPAPKPPMPPAACWPPRINTTCIRA